MAHPRPALFLLLAAVLVVAAIALGHRAPVDSPQPPRPDDARASVRLSHLGLRRPDLAAAAKRFLAVFLRYEIGESDRWLPRTLRRTSTAAFAAELLAAPPRPPAEGRSPPTTLGRLAFATLSSEPPLVLVSGAARRPSGPEQLSFLFEFTGRRWLASAPGE